MHCLLGWCTACLVGAQLAWLVHSLLCRCTWDKCTPFKATTESVLIRCYLFGALLAWLVHLRQVHPLEGSRLIRCYFCAVFLSVADVKSHRHHTESDRAANAIWSGGERNLIGRRTESDRTADGIWSDGGRNPIGRRTQQERVSNYQNGKYRSKICKKSAFW